MRIALTGNPNSGKTTTYNALTGRNEKVGNWAGVTVEKKESPIKKNYYKFPIIAVISDESNISNAKHFLPKSLSDAPMW